MSEANCVDDDYIHSTRPSTLLQNVITTLEKVITIICSTARAAGAFDKKGIVGVAVGSHIHQ